MYFAIHNEENMAMVAYEGVGRMPLLEQIRLGRWYVAKKRYK